MNGLLAVFFDDHPEFGPPVALPMPAWAATASTVMGVSSVASWAQARSARSGGVILGCEAFARDGGR